MIVCDICQKNKGVIHKFGNDMCLECCIDVEKATTKLKDLSNMNFSPDCETCIHNVLQQFSQTELEICKRCGIDENNYKADREG